VLFPAAGCYGSTEPPEIVTLEATLEPADGVVDPVTGSVAMVIGTSQTQIGIGIEGGTIGERLGWAVRNGTCSGSGERVGPVTAFPPIEVGTTGAGESETVLFRRIAISGPYAAEVFANEDATGDVMACADLVRSD
jgi:hypothetical protein